MIAVRSLDELHAQTHTYDRVITADSSLADALNARLIRPVVGLHATTPRGIIYDHHPEGTLPDRGELFLSLTREFDPDWAHLRRVLDRQLSYWQETGSLDGFLTLRSVNRDDPLVASVTEYLRNQPSIFRATESHVPDRKPGTVVLEPEQFTGLDRHVLPDSFDSISFRKDSRVTPEPFQIYPSADELLRAVVELADRTDPFRVAVVLDPGGAYQASLVSRLIGSGVPVMRNHTLDGSPTWRTYQNLLSLREPEDAMPAEDAKPMLNSLGESVPVSARAMLAHRLVGGKSRELTRTVQSASFGEVLTLLEKQGRTEVTGHLEDLESVLTSLGLADRELNRTDVRRLNFYVRSYPPKVATEGSGLLLADPAEAAYLDREVVLYLGMDSSWDARPVNEPWIDPERRHRQHRRTLAVLLQNGTERRFLVQNRRGSEAVQPALSLNELFPRELEEFTDHDHTFRRHPGSAPDPRTFEPLPPEERLEPETKQSFSQSGLSRYTHSPRDAMFSRVLPDIDAPPLAWGRCFHHFAEFYLNHPEFTEQLPGEEWLTPLLDSLRDLMPEDRRDQLGTQLRLGARRLINYFRNRRPETDRVTGYTSLNRPNPLAEHFNRKLTMPFTEAWFNSTAVGLRGQVDLLQSETTLVDFKTGRRRRVSELIGSRNLDELEGKPDFQVLAYLTYHRQLHPDRTLNFEFHFLMDDLYRDWGSETSSGYPIETITYYPRTLADQLPRESTYNYLKASSKKRRKVLDGVGYPAYNEFFSRTPVTLDDLQDEEQLSDRAEQLGDWFEQHFKQARYVRNQAEKSLGKLLTFHDRNLFKPDLDRFQGFVRDQLEAYNNNLNSRFPVQGAVNELDEERLDHPDLLLESF